MYAEAVWRQDGNPANPEVVAYCDPSALAPTYGTHKIVFPVPSAGGRAQAMATHHQARPTPRGGGKRDP